MEYNCALISVRALLWEFERQASEFSGAVLVQQNTRHAFRVNFPAGN